MLLHHDSMHETIIWCALFGMVLLFIIALEYGVIRFYEFP